MPKVPIALAFVALVSIAGWYHSHDAALKARRDLVASTLEPALALLKENEALIKELQAEPFTEKDNGILESYLVKIRRDGVAKTAQMKQKLDQLAVNNSEIVALISGYLPNARTPAFTTQASKFRDYVVAWRDRWNSVMELFMAGGNYTASSVPFPVGFAAAVDAEIAAAK